MEVETITLQEAAKVLKTSPMIIKAAIKNGTMPVGAVAKNDHSTQDRTIIIKTRFYKWLNGEL